MEIILLENIPNLGKLGDVVNVKPGFWRNYLLPQGKASRATKEARAHFEAQRAELQRVAAEKIASAQKLQEKIATLSLTLFQKAGADGRLFGSVTPQDVVDELIKHEISVKKQQVRLHAGLIKAIGQYTIPVVLHPEVTAELTFNVDRLSS